MILLFAIFTLLCSLAKVSGSCDTCQSNFAVCHDEINFSLCLDGTSQVEKRTCPIGYVCTSEPEICSKRSATNSVHPACGTMCGLCKSPDNLFTCLSESVYAYCFGELEPDYSAQGICPNGYVCNFNSWQICTPASEGSSCYTEPTVSTTDGTTESSSTTTDRSTTDSTTENSSTSSSEATTVQISSSTEDSTTTPANPSSTSTSSIPARPTVTSTGFETTTSTLETSTSESTPTTLETESISTTSRPKDEHDFCREKQLAGFFKDESDTTCKQFILCYVISGEYLAMKFACYDDEYYNEETEMCELERPASCQVL